MSEKDVDLFQNELKKLFGEEHYNALDKDVMHDFAAMAACLTPENISHQLSKLNDEIKKKLAEKGMLEDDETIKLKENKDYIGNYKVFSEIMEKWAKDNNFNQGGMIHCLETNEQGETQRKLIELPQQTPVLIGRALVPHVFRGVLQSLGYLFKDLGVTATHGEFTHLLAMYCIVEQNKEHPFLKNDPATLYKMSGNFPYINYKDEKSAFDIIFDLANLSLNKLNSPEHLTDAMTGGRLVDEYGADKAFSSKKISDSSMISDRARVLSEIVTGRLKKRLGEMETDPTPDNVPKLAWMRYQKKPGLMLDECIYFKTDDNQQRQLKFDEIANECSYDINAPKIFALPKINEDDTIIDKLITLFDVNNWKEKHPESEKLANKIYDYLSEIKDDNDQIQHRQITLYLTGLLMNKIGFNHTYDKKNQYIVSLINEAQRTLLEEDQKEFKLEVSPKP